MRSVIFVWLHMCDHDVLSKVILKQFIFCEIWSTCGPVMVSCSFSPVFDIPETMIFPAVLWTTWTDSGIWISISTWHRSNVFFNLMFPNLQKSLLIVACPLYEIKNRINLEPGCPKSDSFSIPKEFSPLKLIKCLNHVFFIAVAQHQNKILRKKLHSNYVLKIVKLFHEICKFTNFDEIKRSSLSEVEKCVKCISYLKKYSISKFCKNL